MPGGVIIQKATALHLPAIVAIYNEAVRRKFETADMEEFTVAGKMDWFQKHDDKHPVFVALLNEEVAGWYSLSAYREDRRALAGVREISYYVLTTHQQMGVGTALLKHAITEAKRLQVDHLVAILLERNERSIRLLEKFHFQKWGHLPEVVNFGGERCAHLYYGLDLALNT